MGDRLGGYLSVSVCCLDIPGQSPSRHRQVSFKFNLYGADPNKTIHHGELSCCKVHALFKSDELNHVKRTHVGRFTCRSNVAQIFNALWMAGNS